MKNNFTFSWSMANALGVSIGFLAFIQTLNFYFHGFNFDLHWDIEAGRRNAEGMEETERALALLKGLALALPVFGLVYTTSQAFVLNKFLENIWQWVVSGGLGFLFVVVVVLPFASIWGDIPGPVEPLTLVMGGTIFTLLLQWRYLRKNGIASVRPLLWYALGVATGLAIVSSMFFGLYYLFGDFWTWAMEIAITGLFAGGFAGLLSANHFNKELHKGELQSTKI